MHSSQQQHPTTLATTVFYITCFDHRNIQCISVSMMSQDDKALLQFKKE